MTNVITAIVVGTSLRLRCSGKLGAVRCGAEMRENMGIIQRFKDIMSANVNALLDKAEDPAKMVDQCLRNLESDLGKVKAETAAVMAEEKRTRRELDECVEQIAKMQTYAERAVRAGNDDDARLFLTKKTALNEKRATLQMAYDAAAENAAQMRQMHDKLVKDISALNARKESIKAKVQVAQAQEKINQMNSKIGSSLNGVSDSMAAFDRMEAKANQMLDQANAMAELNEGQKNTSVEDLVAKYDRSEMSDVDDELEALKAQMGI